MSIARDFVNKFDATKDITEEIRSSVQYLMEIAESKADGFEKDIAIDLSTGKTLDGITVAITKKIASKKFYHVMTKDSVSGKVGRVSDAITSMFTGSAPDIIKGITSIVSEGVDMVLGASEGSALKYSSYLVTVNYPAIVRFDYTLWSHSVRASHIRDHVENMIAAYACVSAVDVSKLDFNTFLAITTPVLNAAYGSDMKNIDNMINQAELIYGKYHKLSVNSMSMKPDSIEDSTNGPVEYSLPNSLTPDNVQRVNGVAL
jgi:hypothetical protein